MFIVYLMLSIYRALCWMLYIHEFITTALRRGHYQLLFADEEPETQRHWVICSQLESGGTEICFFKVCLMLELGFLTSLLMSLPRNLLRDQRPLLYVILLLSSVFPMLSQRCLRVALGNHNPSLPQCLAFIQYKHLNSSENSCILSFLVIFAVVPPVSAPGSLQKIIFFDDSFSLAILTGVDMSTYFQLMGLNPVWL